MTKMTGCIYLPQSPPSVIPPIIESGSTLGRKISYGCLQVSDKIGCVHFIFKQVMEENIELFNALLSALKPLFISTLAVNIIYFYTKDVRQVRQCSSVAFSLAGLYIIFKSIKKIYEISIDKPQILILSPNKKNLTEEEMQKVSTKVFEEIYLTNSKRNLSIQYSFICLAIGAITALAGISELFVKILKY